MAPILPQVANTVVPLLPVWATVLQGLLTTLLPLAAALLGLFGAMRNTDLAHQRTLERETRLRLWQAKRETYVGAIGVVVEFRAAQLERESFGSLGGAMVSGLENIEHELRRATDEHERDRIEGERDRYAARRERSIEEGSAAGRRYRVLEQSLQHWRARVRFDGALGAPEAFQVAAQACYTGGVAYDHALREFERIAHADLKQYQLHEQCTAMLEQGAGATLSAGDSATLVK